LPGIAEHSHLGVILTGVAPPIIGNDILVGAQVWIVCLHRLYPTKIGTCFPVDDAALPVLFCERT
jgi:hypothetical protein